MDKSNRNKRRSRVKTSGTNNDSSRNDENCNSASQQQRVKAVASIRSPQISPDETRNSLNYGNDHHQHNEDCTKATDYQSTSNNNLEQSNEISDTTTTTTKGHQPDGSGSLNLQSQRSELDGDSSAHLKTTNDRENKTTEHNVMENPPSNQDDISAQTDVTMQDHPEHSPATSLHRRLESSPSPSDKPSSEDPSHANSHKRETTLTSGAINSFYGFFICCGLVILFTICSSSKDNRNECTFNKTLALIQSRHFINTLKDDFPSQSQDTWKKLNTLTWKVNQTCNPRWKMPLVYTLAHRPGAFNTSRCLAMKVLAAVRKPFIELNVEGQYNTKHEISKTLKHAFTAQLNQALDSKAIAIFNHLQSLNPELARQFQIYCDNTDAPYKQAVIIFHVALDETYDDVLLSTSEVYMEKEVTKVLRKSWLLMEESSFSPLSVRILQNIVIINTEERLDGC